MHGNERAAVQVLADNGGLSIDRVFAMFLRFSCLRLHGITDRTLKVSA